MFQKLDIRYLWIILLISKASLLCKAMYTRHMIGYSLPIYAKMQLMTLILVQRHTMVKSNVTAPEVDGYEPMINNSHGVFH